MPTGGELAPASVEKTATGFDPYLKATRQADDLTSSEVKTSLLVQAIGPEELEVYVSFAFAQEDDKEKHLVVLQKFEEHYAPKANVICERHQFSCVTVER